MPAGAGRPRPPGTSMARTTPSTRSSRRASSAWRRSSTRSSSRPARTRPRACKRKVVASTTGAGAAGFIPLLLQLVDALKLSPQVAATVTTVVAALGALVAGYLTPDRPPVLPSAPGSVDTSPLDVAPIAPLPAPPSSPRRSARQRPAAQHRPSGHA